MIQDDLGMLPAFPHRVFTKNEADKLVQIVKEKEFNNGSDSVSC